MTAQPAFYNDLAATRDHAWGLLVRGVKDRRSAFHTFQVASIAADGAPSVRTVVNRACSPAAGLLRFHTDLRAAKVAEFAADPRVQIHAYDPSAKIQLRLTGHALVRAVGQGGDDAWAGSRLQSRACYGISPGPGTPIAAAGSYDWPTTDAAILSGVRHFSAVDVTVTRLEWVYLHVDGHRRAVFAASDGWKGQWLAP